MENYERAKSDLKSAIEKQVFITGAQQRISMSEDLSKWIFDFRRILMNGEIADLIGEIFYQHFEKEYPFQIGTLEIGGVPLATSLMNKLYERGHKDSSAFFIRKSRKKTGLYRMVEGQIEPDKKIILVDDVMNSGNSFWRQIEALESLGHKVDTVWSLLRYRDEEYYRRFHLRNIKVRSIFTLDDFTNSLGDSVKNLLPREKHPPKTLFKAQWVFQSENPSLGHVCSKSQPILDEDKIYVGADNKVFWALNQADGSVAWQFHTGPVARAKSVFSNPAIYKDSVIFGAYDGNVYCLDKHTGKPKWINFEADWVGSSPAVADDLGLVFIGLEYGLFGKMGALLALNVDTGETVWIDRSHKAMTHCSPLYIKDYRQVVIGSNDGIVRLHNAETGEVLWKFTAFGAAGYDPFVWSGKRGFSNGDIKEGFVYSSKFDYIMFGSVDGFFYILDRQTGHLVHHEKCDFGIYSAPYIYKDRVYFTSVDKTIRCIDLKTKELVFKSSPDHTRIFSRPVVINDRLYVGTNGGRLHELDPDTGDKIGYFQAVERITNNLVYNSKTDTYFLPTYANEIISLKRID